MYQLAPLVVIIGSGLFLGILAWFYIRRFQSTVIKHNKELEKHERELKRHILELQVLRSLGERVGYSLDLRQILEVIVESLQGLVDFSAVSYMVLSREGKIFYKAHLAEQVSHQFLDQTKIQMLNAFSEMVRQKLYPNLVSGTISGVSFNESLGFSVGSFFNLPLVIRGEVAALINVSSVKKDLYGDEETAVLYTIIGQVSAQASKLSQVIENEKRRLAAMVSSLADGIMMVDPDFNLIVTNPALYRLLSLQNGAGLLEILGAIGNKADLRSAIGQSLHQQIAVKLPEFELLNSAIQIDIEPVKDKLEYILGAVIVCHDVSAQKQIESLRESFTAMMVHELRTPLTTISYSTDMMLTDAGKLSAVELGKNLEIIKSTTAQMLSLVNELLDIAKIEAGKFEIVKKEDNLQTLVEEKLAAFKPLTDQKQLQLVAEIGPNLPKMEFDKRRLGQVFDNLLSNAVKYSNEGQVKIKVEVGNREVLVSVSDSGEGIKSEDLPKLFSKFEQLGKGKTGEKGGTGLGLVVSKGIVEAHNGKIWVSSEGIGKGTTFTFSLPLST